MSNFFNLPPPWNPGYALPQNVEDEGLQRHGYVTAWARRGTFDNPTVGTAGYVVPEYVKSEGYGRGAMVTRWADRGSYFGPKIKHWLDRPSAIVTGTKRLPGGATKMQIEAMAGVETARTGMPVYTAYGLQVARDMIAGVISLPDAERKRVLKLAMDRIDPKLYSRAERAAQPELKAGAAPLVALERGIAQAVSHGLTEELIAVGKGKMPAKKSQLGGVIYRRGLGGLPITKYGLLTAEFQAAPEQQICIRPGYTFVEATAASPAHWERLMAGRDPNSGNPGWTSGGACAPTEIREHGGTATGPGMTPEQIAAMRASMAANQAARDQPHKMLQVGPFTLPIARQVGIHYTLNAEQQAFVDAGMTAIKQMLGSQWTANMGAGMMNGSLPFAKFKRPADPADPYAGKTFGLYFKKDPDGKTYILYKEFVPGKGLLDTIVAAAKWVASAVVDVVKAVVDEVKDKTCDLMSSSVGKIAAGAAGAYVGGPAGAAAAVEGAKAVEGACSSPAQQLSCPPGQMPDPSGTQCVAIPPPSGGLGGSLPLLLLGGAGIAAFLILGKKK
jgi:hypothetical protein